MRNDPAVTEPVIADLRRLRRAISDTALRARRLKDEQALVWSVAASRGVTYSVLARESGVSDAQVRAEVGRARRELVTASDQLDAEILAERAT